MKNTECIVFERTPDTEPENPRNVCVFVSSVLIPSSINRWVDSFASFASYVYSRRICSLEFFIAYRLRACLHAGGGPQVGEATRLGGVTRLSI